MKNMSVPAGIQVFTGDKSNRSVQTTIGTRIHNGEILRRQLNPDEVAAIKASVISLIKSDRTNKTIDEGAQGIHLRGHKNYQGKSYLLEDIEPQTLVDQLAGQGDPRLVKRTGEWTRKEFFEADRTIGVSVNLDGSKEFTNRFSITYGKNGTHVIPRSK